jgi:hypothetical protein
VSEKGGVRQGEDKGPDRPAGDGPRRLPYEKPSVRWEHDLGSRPGLIAACNKTAPLVGPCDTGSLQS